MRDSHSSRRIAAAAVVALVATGLGAAALSAAPAPGTQAPDARWQPWVGCWQPVTEPGSAASDADGAVVCVVPDGAGVRIVSYAGGRQASERRIVADGQPQPVTDDGCTGTGTARWSEDGFRVFLESDLSCGTRGETRGSGVMAMLPGARWLDARSVMVQDQPLMRVVRYRLADDEALQSAGVPAGLVPAQETPETLARMAAASPLGTADVIEASKLIRPEVLQVLLAERHAGFDLDAATLEQLADAGVPGEVTDLMVALSNPDRFAVDAGSGAIGAAADVEEQDGGRSHVAYVPGMRVHTAWDCGYGFDPYWGNSWGYGYGYGYGANPFCGGYGYGYGPYSPYGFGSGYGWWAYAPGQVIVVRPSGSDAGGSAVPGRGYTHRSGSGSSGRVAHPRVTSDGYRAPRSAAPRAGSSGSSGGSSSGGSAPVRHAHPRGGSHH